ncbi:MAG TPA: tetratricopeptide repeat protein [Gemmatimonadaceae bacterium]|nr:tetratricopeptide repeat protein [Gemmatimonadaceae bacterium]
MTAGLPRVAREAMDAARAAVSRLDPARDPEDNAAYLVEAWDGAQAALRALSGVTILSGQELIREARTRNLLSLDQAHALVEFSTAAERARQPGYDVSARDIDSARAGFLVFESVAQSPGERSGSSASVGAPGAGSAAGVPGEPAAAPAAPARTRLPSRFSRRSILLGTAIVVLVIAGVGTFLAVRARAGPAHLAGGIAAYRQGDLMTAAREFTAAAERMPRAAMPHVYLARLAREAGNASTAVAELTTAIRLEPENPIALREMAAHQLAMNDLEMARRFYVRALEHDPQDRMALGYLACTLARLGRLDEAQRFHQRAGPGEWNVCLGMVAPPPGVAPPR